ncbi:kinase-like protein [Hymenopellis radicata]|nr:kinase-like protein [Hymenopellis radicata]
MLQYPVLRPISSSTKVRAKDHASYHSPDSRNDSRNDQSRFPSSLTSKRIYKDAVPRPQYTGLPPPAPTFSFIPNSAPSPTLTSSKLPRNPYISSRQASISVPIPRPASSKSPASSRRSSLSSNLDDVLFPGDFVGHGAQLQGELIRLVSIDSKEPPPSPSLDEPAQEFEVVRRLGAGSYAVVYLVREVLYRPPPSEDGHVAAVGAMEMDSHGSKGPSTVYGREYAIKCLSKANLDEEALAAQMSEVTIHQSLDPHPNIVTLHRTLETSSFLLLLLEYVPGEDLFYFLEQARDHYETDSPTCTDPSPTCSRTPPTPSLLSNLHPSQLLSRRRLRLISSMFSQMCDAVAACHAQQVFHRDIKPENFIVTDGWHTTADGRQERKVIVKLTDFGLSTTDVDSSDMDCGSAPYMSYECRNNVAPTYSPRAADVWSLGIVLINMLYHYNPWTDTHQGACKSFDLFRRSPVDFFLQRFTGMTRPVAEMLANRVFNVLEDTNDDSSRISAVEFGSWVKDLPELLGNHPTPVHHQRGLSISSTQGYPISTSVPPSHRPSSRQASRTSSAIRTPAMATRSLSRAPSLEPAYERPTTAELPSHIPSVQEQDEPQEILMTSRSTSTNKRRKRGARKGKGAIVGTPTTPKDETLATLAVASQSLAREISKASKVSSMRSTTSSVPSTTSTTSSARRRRDAPYEPVSMYALPLHYCPKAKPWLLHLFPLLLHPLLPHHPRTHTRRPRRHHSRSPRSRRSGS